MAGNTYKRRGQPTVRPDVPPADDEALVVWVKGGGTGPGPIVPIPVIPAPATSSILTSVPSSAAAVLISASDPTRYGVTIRNSASQNFLFLELADTATVTAAFHSVALSPGAYYEVPFRYTGNIHGIWDGTVDGAALVTTFFA